MFVSTEHVWKRRYVPMDFVSMTLGLTLISGYIALFLQPNNADAFLKSFFF